MDCTQTFVEVQFRTETEEQGELSGETIGVGHATDENQIPVSIYSGAEEDCRVERSFVMNMFFLSEYVLCRCKFVMYCLAVLNFICNLEF